MRRISSLASAVWIAYVNDACLPTAFSSSRILHRWVVSSSVEWHEIRISAVVSHQIQTLFYFSDSRKSALRRQHIALRFLANILHPTLKSSPYSITERRVPELIPVLDTQPAGDVSHKPSGRLPLLSARPAVTPATLKGAATNFSAWWTEAQWVWTACLRLLPDSVVTAIWTRALLRLTPAH